MARRKRIATDSEGIRDVRELTGIFFRYKNPVTVLSVLAFK
jgi:hypothetical protein